MKKALFVALALLIVTGASSLWAEEETGIIGGSFGLKYLHMKPNDEDQIEDTARGISLNILYDAEPNSDKAGKIALQVFYDFVSRGVEVDKNLTDFNFMEEMTYHKIDSKGVGASILYYYQTKPVNLFFGGGLGYYSNTMKGRDDDLRFNYIEPSAILTVQQAAPNGLGAGAQLTELVYWEKVENGLGLHLTAGAEFKINDTVRLALEVKQLVLKSDINYYVQWSGIDAALTNTSSWWWDEEGTVNLGGLSVGLGLHLWF